MKTPRSKARLILSLCLLLPTLGYAKKEKFISLFNGKDLKQWVLPKGEHTWKIVDGIIDYESKGGNLTTKKSFSDYVLKLDWRFKRTAGPPYNAKIFDKNGNQKLDADGKPMTRPIKNADSGVFVRGSGKSQVNLWCWPCGSGQLWAFHKSEDPVLRKGALPKVNADKPVGEWNEMEITMKGETVSIVLNGKTVLDQSKMPGVGASGPIVLQHHGGYNEKNKTWSSASALIQFRNLFIKEL
ncbi:DUF1080 domain-containing protein [Verrucomicrobia bacterium]|nr:DUF1080 domain-containing protein [Verrucomicrobiota bacterium]